MSIAEGKKIAGRWDLYLSGYCKEKYFVHRLLFNSSSTDTPPDTHGYFTMYSVDGKTVYTGQWQLHDGVIAWRFSNPPDIGPVYVGTVNGYAMSGYTAFKGQPNCWHAVKVFPPPPVAPDTAKQKFDPTGNKQPAKAGKKRAAKKKR